MRVQIAICTWNRAAVLDRTLDQMRLLTIPADTDLELVIVDNSSNDDTQDVIQHYGSCFHIRSLTERRQGHCYARNCAVEAIDGDIVIWTDDDVLVDIDWLDAYVAAARSQRDCSFWGGPIIPFFDERRPQWLKENWELCRACYAFRDIGDKPVAFHERLLPYGANFALRTDVQKQFKFNTSLGRRGREVTGEDEVDLLRRLVAAGHRGCWVPGARLRHLITPDRVTEKFVGAYFFGQGKVEAMRNYRNAGSPSKLLYESLTQRALYRLKRNRVPSKVWLTHLVRASLARGKWAGLRQAKSVSRSRRPDET